MPIYLTSKRAKELQIPENNLRMRQITPGYFTWIKRSTARELMQGGNLLEKEQEMAHRIVAKANEIAESKKNVLEFRPTAEIQKNKNGSLAVVITKHIDKETKKTFAVVIVDFTKKNKELHFVFKRERIGGLRYSRDSINDFEKDLTELIELILKKA